MELRGYHQPKYFTGEISVTYDTCGMHRHVYTHTNIIQIYVMYAIIIHTNKYMYMYIIIHVCTN